MHLQRGGRLRRWLLAPERSRLLERGRLVAALLEGSWRDPPPAPGLSTAELSEIGPLLLATGMAGLAWRRLRACSELESSPVIEILRQAFRAHVLESAVHAHQLGEVMALMRTAKIAVLVGKGWAVARLYPEPGLRPYGDLDLYVTPQTHAAAHATLRRPVVPPGPVDLHRGFSDLDDLGEETLFSRSRTVALGSGQVPLFGPEDHLRLLCLHGLRHGLSRPLWLCDVAVALESRPPDFDWDRLRAGDRGRAQAVACALGLAQELLGARVEGIPAPRCALPSWLVPAVLRQWGSGSGWREPMASFLRRPAGVLRELRGHWPNPIEATMGLRAPFDDFPRLPLQLAFAAARAARFGRRLPAELHARVPRLADAPRRY